MAYRLEYASTGRAACKAPEPCKGTKIEKGALRFGTGECTRSLQRTGWQRGIKRERGKRGEKRYWQR